MTQILGNDKQGLVFEIVSARISEEADDGKKHVIYTLQVRFISGSGDDLNPVTVERRYTNFLELYTSLCKEYPSLMTNVTFPKKVMFGNFDNVLISARSTGFESLLKHISTDSKLRTSNALLMFLRNNELSKAKLLLEKADFTAALPLLENNFKLLNKVFTDRHSAVLLALCRLLFCTMSIPGMPNAAKYAELALHRYEGVSDSDLLELYIPLLHCCLKIYKEDGKCKEKVNQRLLDLQKQGISTKEKYSLETAVNNVEIKLFGDL